MDESRAPPAPGVLVLLVFSGLAVELLAESEGSVPEREDPDLPEEDDGAARVGVPIRLRLDREPVGVEACGCCCCCWWDCWELVLLLMVPRYTPVTTGEEQGEEEEAKPAFTVGSRRKRTTPRAGSSVCGEKHSTCRQSGGT